MAKKLTPDQVAEKEAAKAKKAAEAAEKKAAKKSAEDKPQILNEGIGVFGQKVQVMKMKDKSLKVVNWKPTGEKIVDVDESTVDDVFKAECENPVISGE